MLPEKLHTDAIKKFHKEYEKLNEKIDELRKDEKKNRDELYELLRLNMKFYDMWSVIDEFVEFNVKHFLQLAKHENVSHVEEFINEIKK